MKLYRCLIALFVLAGFTSMAHAQLVVEITSGQANAVPIAVVPYGWPQGATPAPLDVAEVVAADLARSGRFIPLDRRDMIERPTSSGEINFQDWRYLRADYITVGRMMPQGAGQYRIEFELHNVLNGERLLGQSLTASDATLRSSAHRIADLIFEQLTGIPGAFSTRLAFINVEGTPEQRRYQLIVSDSDGENQVVVAGSNEPLMSPAWSPDGQSLAYVSFESRNSAIYVQTLRTGERRRISARAGINGAPAWAPDGRRMALTLSRKDGDVDVYMLDLSTQVLSRLTFDPGIDTEPSWAPDGKRLYFTSDRAGAPQIYEIDVSNPSKPRRITFEGTYNSRARVSPDGKQLAVVHLDRGNYRIALVDLENRGLRVLTNGNQDESPSFAPNGATLIYATQDRGRGLLATVSVDGSVSQRLSAERGDVREPVWSPFPGR